MISSFVVIAGEKVQTDFYENKMPTFLTSELSQTEGNHTLAETTSGDALTLTLPEKPKVQSLRNKTKKPQCKLPCYFFLCLTVYIKTFSDSN